VLTTPVIALAAILALALAISGCSSSSSSQSTGTPAATASSSTPGAVNPGGPIQGATTTCTYTPTGSGSVSLPPSKTNPTTLYTATMHTSQGDIVIRLASGLAILQKVAQAGTTCAFAAGGGVPKDKVIINSVTITKG
jgi:hypothetical protein